MQYGSTHPALGQSIQSEGLVNFIVTMDMFLTLKNCMNVCPGPQKVYNSKHMDINPTRRVYTVPCIRTLGTT